MSSDRRWILAHAKRDAHALKDASPALRNSKEFILASVKQNGMDLQYAGSRSKREKEIVLAAVIQSGMALQFASETMKKDKEIILAAVVQDGWALKDASPELKDDKEVVHAAVRQNGLALQYANPTSRNDKQIVMTAVQQYGRGLQYANEELKNDREIVLAAVKQNGNALVYASPRLQNDKQIVLIAAQQNGNALQYAGETLQNDKELMSMWKYTDMNPSRSSYLDLPNWPRQVGSTASTPTASPNSAISLRSDRSSSSLSPYIYEPSSTQSATDLEARIRDLQVQIDMTRNQSVEHWLRDEANTEYLIEKLFQTLKFQALLRKQISTPTLGTPQPLSVEDHIVRGQQLFDQYVADHPTLQLGFWISIVDDNPRTLQVFSTYQAAGSAHRSHELWFCSQHLGRGTPHPMIEETIPCPFGAGDQTGDHFLYSYVDAQISDPRPRRQGTCYPRMMIDTGAMVCVGAREKLENFRTVSRRLAGVLGAEVLMTYVDIEIILRETPPVAGTILTDDLTLDPVYVQIGYPAQPKKGEQWILGQSVLSLFRHNWTTNTRVTMQYPTNDPTIQYPA